MDKKNDSLKEVVPQENGTEIEDIKQLNSNNESKKTKLKSRSKTSGDRTVNEDKTSTKRKSSKSVASESSSKNGSKKSNIEKSVAGKNLSKNLDISTSKIHIDASNPHLKILDKDKNSIIVIENTKRIVDLHKPGRKKATKINDYNENDFTFNTVQIPSDVSGDSTHKEGMKSLNQKQETKNTDTQKIDDGMKNFDEEQVEVKVVQDKKRRFALRPVHYIALGFILMILFGAFLLCLPVSHESGNWFGFVDSLFTSTSAVCVTGLTVSNVATEFTTFGEVVIMLLIQFGGLGFMSFATLLFIAVGKKITLKERLTMQEAFSENKMHGLSSYAKLILIMTFGVEILGMCLLMISFVPTFGFGKGTYYAMFHSVSAFCNAGFDLFGGFEGNGILTSFQGDVVANLSIMMLIIIGGLGFMVVKDVFSNKVSKWTQHTKIVLIATGVLILIPAILFAFMEWNNPLTLGNMSSGEKVLASLFQAVTPRTAGFASIDQGSLTAGSTCLTMFLMFIGASPASTGGGIKTTTFVVLILILMTGIKGEKNVVLGKREVVSKVAFKAMAIMLFAVVFICFVSFIICVIEIDYYSMNMSVTDIFFESFSAFGTVGLTRGITPDLHTVSKLLLSILMYCGRLGTITLGLFFIKPNKKDKLNIKYGEVNINIG